MKVRPVLLLAGFLLAARAGALENAFVVSDTVGYLEKAFGVKARTSAWFLSDGGSTLNFSFAGKGGVSFRLAQAAPADRYVHQVQVEPSAGALTVGQATAFVKFLTDDLARSAHLNCAVSRDDQDGMNAFLTYSCADKTNPSVTIEAVATIQSTGGRNLIFVSFNPTKH